MPAVCYELAGTKAYDFSERETAGSNTSLCRRKGEGMKKRILWFVVDLTIAAMIVLAEWIAGYKLPQKGIRAAAFPQAVNERASERDTSTD